MWFTFLFLATMLAANLLSGSIGQDLPGRILADWGIGYNSVMSGEVFRLITGTFLSHDPGMALRQFLFAATVIGYAEWMQGSARTAALFFGLDIVATLLLLGCIGWGAGVIDLAATNDVGMSIGGFGLIGTIMARWQYAWLWLAATLLAIALKFAVAPEVLADSGHVLALVLGFALQIFVSALTNSRKSDHAR
ncbi:MAG: hypothetical protein WAT09_09965 [Paracoccaceae bacterium]